MSEYDNNNRGAFWKNDRKETDRHPDWTGSATINGVEGWLSGWVKKKGDKDKAPLLRFQFRPKDEARAPQQQAAPAQDDFDDDIPF